MSSGTGPKRQSPLDSRRSSRALDKRAGSSRDLGAWFFSKQVFLFDLDGTLYLGKRILPGARELVARLRQSGKQVFFFTNNSSRSDSDYVAKLRRLGFHARADEVVMSTHSLLSYVKAKKMKHVFLLGTPSMVQMLKRGGLRVWNASSGVRDFRKLAPRNLPDAVVVGFDKTLTYDRLLIAARLIDRGVPYVVTHPDYFCPTDEGPEPDCGAIAKLLELTTPKSPLAVLGKPHPSMIRIALERVSGPRARGTRRGDVVLIGDRLTTDIAMARAAGIDAVLVLSGETKRRDLRGGKLPKSVRVVSGVLDLINSYPSCR